MNTIALLLDLDGVLITTPLWKQDELHVDGYSDFNAICVENLNALLKERKFDIYLTSTRRTNKTLAQFNQIFKNRRIIQDIKGFLPQYESQLSRKEEIERFLLENQFEHFLILDDDKSTTQLQYEIKEFLILTEYAKGFTAENIKQALAILK